MSTPFICRQCKNLFALEEYIDEKTREIFIHCSKCRSLVEAFANNHSYSNRTEETCPCGSTFKSISKRLHLKTKKHRDFYKWNRMKAELRKQRKSFFFRAPKFE